MKKTVTAIICAYNEERYIETLLKNIYDTGIFDEIIVINDGSDDQTGKIVYRLARELKIKDLHFIKNMGKGNAMAKGVEMARSEILVFIDADLCGFTAKHAEQLLSPILQNKASMVLGQATKTLIHPKINPFRKLSGQRSVKRTDLLPLVENMRDSGYGVETLINIHIKEKNKKVKYVNLENLGHPTKFQKSHPLKALKEYLTELKEIIKTYNIKTKAGVQSYRKKYA